MSQVPKQSPMASLMYDYDATPFSRRFYPQIDEEEWEIVRPSTSPTTSPTIWQSVQIYVSKIWESVTAFFKELFEPSLETKKEDFEREYQVVQKPPFDQTLKASDAYYSYARLSHIGNRTLFDIISSNAHLALASDVFILNSLCI